MTSQALFSAIAPYPPKQQLEQRVLLEGAT